MQRTEYLVVLFFVKLSKILPLSFVFTIFDLLGLLFFWLLKSRRKLAISNLSYAYPQKSQKEIYDLAKANFKSVAKTAAEILLLFCKRKKSEDFLINKDEILKKMREITKDNKNGIVFLTAHFGNWEILADFLAMSGYSMVVIGREGDNKLIEKNLTKPFRERNGNQNAYKKEAMSKMVKTLKNGGNVGLLIDQKAGKINSVEAEFFGRKCDTTISIASMKLRYDSIVIPMFAIRQKSGKYHIAFDGAVAYNADDKNDKNDKIKALTQRYNDALEKAIRKAPEQWFWMHDRWKTG
jgi:KDO2-lipid IV(A) lauroyltransferase